MIYRFSNIIAVYCLCTLFFMHSVAATGNSTEAEIGASILLARNSMDIGKLDEWVQHFEEDKTELKASQQYYYLSFLHLSIGIHFLNTDEQTKAFAHLNNALSYINKSLKFAASAETLILKAHLVDFQILFESSRTTELLHIFWHCLDQAQEIDLDNPRYYLVQGLHLYFAPSFAGGDIQLAKQNLQKAVHLFATNIEAQKFYVPWGYEDALAWLGQIAVQQDSLELALNFYNQALSVNDNFGWVKYKLLPELKSRIDFSQSIIGIIMRFLGIIIVLLLLISGLLWSIKVKIIKI